MSCFLSDKRGREGHWIWHPGICALISLCLTNGRFCDDSDPPSALLPTACFFYFHLPNNVLQFQAFFIDPIHSKNRSQFVRSFFLECPTIEPLKNCGLLFLFSSLSQMPASTRSVAAMEARTPSTPCPGLFLPTLSHGGGVLRAVAFHILSILPSFFFSLHTHRGGC